MRFSLIPFLLLVVPLTEIAVFILVGGEIGLLMTLALIFLTAVLGSILLRIQGFGVLSRIQQLGATGELPGRELVNGFMIVIAGVLLLTPGFVTDAIGFLLFIPGIRDAIWSSVASRIVIRTGNPFDSRRGKPDAEPDVVDLDADEYSEKQETRDPGGRPIESPWGRDH